MADLPRHQLIDGDARADVRRALLQPDAGQERSVTARMIACAIGPAGRRAMIQTAEDLDQPPARFQRLESAAERELGPLVSWATTAAGMAPLGKYTKAVRSGAPVAVVARPEAVAGTAAMAAMARATQRPAAAKPAPSRPRNCRRLKSGSRRAAPDRPGRVSMSWNTPQLDAIDRALPDRPIGRVRRLPRARPLLLLERRRFDHAHDQGRWRDRFPPRSAPPVDPPRPHQNNRDRARGNT